MICMSEIEGVKFRVERYLYVFIVGSLAEVAERESSPQKNWTMWKWGDLWALAGVKCKQAACLRTSELMIISRWGENFIHISPVDPY